LVILTYALCVNDAIYDIKKLNQSYLVTSLQASILSKFVTLFTCIAHADIPKGEREEQREERVENDRLINGQ
jgi:hypothetical protein